MTWQHTFPDPTMYYHAPHKTIAHNPRPDQLIDGPRYALTLWTPQHGHDAGDPYHPSQQGHPPGSPSTTTEQQHSTTSTKPSSHRLSSR